MVITEEAFVSLATADSYAVGCLVLGHSLRKHGTQRLLVALITDNINPKLKQLLAAVYDVVQTVPAFDTKSISSTFAAPEAFVTKLHCWHLTQFKKCVFLEADTLVLQNCDELFSRPELSAVPDVGWPDTFNTGVFVFVPSMDTYWALVNLLKEKGSYDGGDQGILNTHFGRDWSQDLSKRLPFVYNLVCSSSYTYAPAFHKFGSQAKIVHFLGHPKPWSVSWNPQTGQVQLPGDVFGNQYNFFQQWVDIFVQQLMPLLPAPCLELVHSKATVTAWDLKCFLKDPKQKKLDRETQIILEGLRRARAAVPAMLHPQAEVSKVASRTSNWHTEGVVPLSTSSSSLAPFSLSAVRKSLSVPPPIIIKSPLFKYAVSKFQQRADRKIKFLEFTPPADVVHFPPKEHMPLHPQISTPSASKGKPKVHVPGFFSSSPKATTAATSSDHYYSQAKGSSPPRPPSPTVSGVNQQPPKQAAAPPSPAAQSTIPTSPNKATTPHHEQSTVEIPQSPYIAAQVLLHNLPAYQPECPQQVPEVVPAKAVPVLAAVDESIHRRQRWEEGTMDYLGRDSFDNIWKRLNDLISKDSSAMVCASGLASPSTTTTNTQEPVASTGGASPAAADADSPPSPEPPADNTAAPGYPIGDYTGMHLWEQGYIDYDGRDRSDNIMRRLDFLIQKGPDDDKKDA